MALVDSADVFIHNFRPGVVERLGLDAETLRQRNPRLVYCAISGFGEMGPRRHEVANDIAAQAYGGLMSIVGEPDGAPIRVPIQIADITTGYNAAIAILAALVGRVKTGEGSTIRTSLFETVLALMGQYFVDYFVTGIPMARLGSQNRHGQPNQAFSTSDGFIVIASTGQEMWKRFVKAMEHPELGEDPRFSTLESRIAHQTELVEAILAITSQFTTEQLANRLKEHDVICAPILTIDQLVDDPQAKALNIHTAVNFEEVKVPITGSPLRCNGERLTRGDVPSLGQHMESVMRELGSSETDIESRRMRYQATEGDAVH